MRPPIWKRSYILEPKLQFEITLYLSLFMIAALTAIFFSVRQSLLAVLHLSAQASPSCAVLLNDNEVSVKLILNTVFLSNGFVVFLFALVGGILISHRVVGPIFRVKAVLKKIAQGEDPGKIQIRKSDFFPELVPLLEELKKSREK